MYGVLLQLFYIMDLNILLYLLMIFLEQRDYIYLTLRTKYFSYFLEFQNRVENQFNAKIKIFRSDNGIEFVNNNF
jgi:hypothetical protein